MNSKLILVVLALVLTFDAFMWGSTGEVQFAVFTVLLLVMLALNIIVRIDD